MLQVIREKATGVIGMILVAVIILVFALFGISQYFEGGSVPPIATVNGEDVSRIQYQNSVQQRRSQIMDMFGGNVPQGMFDSPEFKEEILQGLIRNQLVGQIAEQSGYQISDLQLAEHIKSIPAFQENSVFNADKYDQFIERRRGSKQAFEAEVRHSMILDQVSSAYQASAFLSQESLAKYAALANQSRKISYTILKADNYKDAVNVSDADIETYFDANTDEFMTAEQMKLQYVLLDEEALAASMTVTEDEMQEFYEDNKDSYQSPESRNVSHILLKTAEGSNAEQLEQIETRAQEALAKISSGEDFAVVAKDVSEDDLTVNTGGDLGEIFRGDLDPAIDSVIFSLDQSGVSGLIKTSRGFQIVKVDGINSGQVQSFDAVKERIEEELRHQKVESAFNDKSTELNNLNFENSDSLEILADGTGLQIQQTEWFDRTGGEGLVSDSVVVEAAFSDLVFNQKQNSELIDLVNGGQVVVHFLDYKKPETKMLAEIKDELSARLIAEATVKAARDKGMDLVASLEGGADFAQLATQESVELRELDELKRHAENVPQVIRSQAFKMSFAGGAPTYSGLELQNGNFAIIQLEAINNGTAADIVSGDASGLSEILRNEYSVRELEGMYKAMEARADIEIFRDNMGEGNLDSHGHPPGYH